MYKIDISSNLTSAEPCARFTCSNIILLFVSKFHVTVKFVLKQKLIIYYSKKLLYIYGKNLSKNILPLVTINIFTLVVSDHEVH